MILEPPLIFRSDIRAQLMVRSCDNICQSLDNEMSQHRPPPPKRALTASDLGLMTTEITTFVALCISEFNTLMAIFPFRCIHLYLRINKQKARKVGFQLFHCLTS